MKKYLVMSMDKETGEVRSAYIYDECPTGDRIAEYLDSIGNVIWASYPDSVSTELANKDFSAYIDHYMSRCCAD